MSDLRELLLSTATRVADYQEKVNDLAVFPTFDFEAVRASLGSMRDEPTPPAAVIKELADIVEPTLVSSTGSRYFGFVIGGALDAATAADMLTTGWDQNAFNTISSPGAALVEDVTGAWLKEVLGLPASASFGFATGGQGANTTSLAAARHHVLAQAGWDVESDGLGGAPRLRVVANAERHATIDMALRVLGIGTGALEAVATDAQGAIDIADLERVLSSAPPGPTIVCLQAGNVNSGAFDDFSAAIDVAREHGAWVHVDGAFGLWAAANPHAQDLVKGMDRADSWATDGHKWLNVPYDSGFVFCAHPQSHAASMAYSAAYLKGQGEGDLRLPGDFVLESSRRARGFATYAALRQLGRNDLAALIERCCALARRFAQGLSEVEGVTVLNDVVLNQVLVHFGSDDETDRVITTVQRSGDCWMGATSWHGTRAMRISVSSWRTTEADVDRSLDAILRALGESE